MDRNREVKRGQPMANGLSRRRPQRSGGSGMRDSPEEAVAGEMQETTAVRLRDRKKDRLSRSKRRRGEQLHGNREEGAEDSSEESVDVEEEDDEDDEDLSAADHRRGVPPQGANIVKPPWKVPDEMIGVPVPRKARSASVKRSHESSISGGGEQIPTLRQCSTSPATPSVASVSPPPSSNASVRRRVKPIGAKQRPSKVPTVSIQEEIEIEVAEVLFGLRQYPAPAVNPELTGNSSPLKLEDREEESPALLGKPRASSPISSPQQSVGVPPKASSSTVAASPSAGAPKRKRPRPVKPEEEKSGVGSGAVSTVPVPSIVKGEAEKLEVSSPRGDENSFLLVSNDVDGAKSIKLETNQEAKKPHLIPEEKFSAAEGAAEGKVVLDATCSGKSEAQVEMTGSVKPVVCLEDATKGVSSSLTCDGQKEMFKFDLMASPAKSMVGGDISGDSTSEIDAVNAKEENSVVDLKENAVEKVELDVLSNDSEPEKRAEMRGAGEQAKQNKGRMVDLCMDEEKSVRESGKQQGQKHSKVSRVEIKAPEVCTQWEKSVPHSSGTAPAMAGPSPLPMTIAGWPGGLPPLGYIAQAPPSWPGTSPIKAVVSMEGNTGAPTLQPHILLPQQRYKRCATHCYIAKVINYLHHVINPFWAAASNASLFGAKPCNLNLRPSTEGMTLGGPLSSAFPAANFTAAGRTAGPTHEKGNGNATTFGGQASKEKAPAQIVDGQRKHQTTMQQPALASSATNIPHGSAIIFPLNQVAEAVRPGGSKAPVTGYADGPSACQVGGAMASSGAAATVCYNYANLPTNEAQYIAMVQSSGYPFQIPAHAAAAASAYRGSSALLGQAAAAAPPQFFTGSFYTSQMLHPSQIQQTQSQALQQGHQSNSSGSSSSHKQPQQQRLQGCGGSSSNNYKQQQQLQQESEQQAPQRTRQSPANALHPNHSSVSHLRQDEADYLAEGDSPSAADGQTSPNFLNQTNHHHPTLSSSYSISPLPVPIHHAQNFSIMSSSLGSIKNGEKPHLLPQSSDPHPQYSLKGMEFVPPQTFAMSFPPGIDLSMAQGHHAIIQNLPEPYRQSYQLAAAQGVAAAASAHQQHVQSTTKQKMGDEGSNVSDHVGGGAASQEERTVGGAKATPAIASQTLTFSRQPENNGNASISIFSSSSTHVSSAAILENQSRSLNLVSAAANGTRASCLTSISGTNTQQSQSTARSKSATSNASVPTVSPHTATAISYNDRHTVSMFPGGLSAFPQALIQGTTAQSPQWKSATAAVPSTGAVGSVSSPPKQPKGLVTGPGSSPAHSQISFASSGVNAKITAMPMEGHVTHVLPNSSLSSTVSSAALARLNSSAPAIGSATQSVTKSTVSPSSRTAPTTKGGVLSAPVPAASQPLKNSHASCTRKSSPPLGGRNNLPSILGHPQLVQSSSPKQSQQQQQQPVQSLNLKNQHQSQQQLNKAQYQPAQIFFSKNYLTAQSTQPPQLVGYYPKPFASLQPSISNLPQRRPSSEQSQNSPSVSSNSAATGALSLGGSSLSLTTSASESLKSGSANNAAPRGGSVGVLHTHQFTTPLNTAANRANNPTAAAVVAAAATFPYLHAVSTVPMKSAENSSTGAKQKQEKIQ